MERNKLADRLKGYACLLVLTGHVFSGLSTAGTVSIPAFMPVVEKFIWTFHIDLFMFLSGFVYTLTGGCSKKGNRFKFILNKLINLGIPYVVFSVVYIVVNSLVPGVNNKSSITDVFRIFTEPVAQYWFLYALFFLFMIWTVLSLFLDNRIITCITFSLLIISKIFGFSYGILDSTLNCALAFGLGTCISSLDFRRTPKWVKITSIPVHVAAVITLIITGFIKYILVDDIATVLGIFASVFFIAFISKIKAVGTFLDMICRYSFPIYLLHTFFTSFTRIMLIKLGITNYIIHVVSGTFVGLGLSLLVAWICSLIPVFEIFFYPSRTVKKLKKRAV